MKRSTLVVVIVLSLGLAAIFGLRIADHQTKAAAPEKTEAQSALVYTARPERRSLSSALRFSGVVRPRNEVDVSAKVAGRIQELRADVGAEVKAGAVLVVVEHKELGFQSDQAAAQVEAVEAQVLQARLQLASAQQQQQRVAALKSGGAVADTESDRAELGLKAAEAGLRAAQAQLKLAQAAAGLAGRALQNSFVTAPITGTVTKRLVSVGTQIAPGQPLFQLQDVAELKLAAAISGAEFGRISLGQAVKIQLEELPGVAITGTVATMSPTLDPMTRRAALEIAIDNSERRLLPNMFAHAEVEVGQRDNVLTVPASAVVTLVGGKTLYVVREGTAKAVSLGEIDVAADYVAVDGVLSESDEVIVRGQSSVSDGAPVRIGSDGKP
jgi:membrane fusion protein (multidrug efflux system)